MKKLSIIGAGAWGSALVSAFSSRFEEITLWCYLKQEAEGINQYKENKTYLPGVSLPKVKAVTDLSLAVRNADIVISAIPSFSIRSVWVEIAKLLPKETIFINASKGVEKDSYLLPHQLFAELFPHHTSYFTLSGPSFAALVGKGHPTAVHLGGVSSAYQVIAALQTETFYLQYTPDILGVELGGIVKNVIAIASGIALGLGYGANTQAAIITAGSKEIMQLACALGAKEETVLGLSGIGDLVLTATDTESRNVSFGKAIGEGKSVQEAVTSLKGVSEGYYTTQSLLHFMEHTKLQLPLCSLIVEIVLNGASPKENLLKTLRSIYFFKDSI
jgi:glycerol-3-phosphate dehydrogenase (NAD(P)+)